MTQFMAPVKLQQAQAMTCKSNQGISDLWLNLQLKLEWLERIPDFFYTIILFLLQSEEKN